MNEKLPAIIAELVEALIEAMRADGIDAEDKCDLSGEGELCCALCRSQGCIAWKVQRAQAALLGRPVAAP